MGPGRPGARSGRRRGQWSARAGAAEAAERVLDLRRGLLAATLLLGLLALSGELLLLLSRLLGEGVHVLLDRGALGLIRRLDRPLAGRIPLLIWPSA